MPAPANLVHETSTTTGTGNLTLVNVNGKNNFNDAFGTGGSDVFDYFVSNQSAAEWERGTGHMSDSTTLVRDTVIESTNSNNAVNFSAGTKDVTNDVPALNQFIALPGVNALVVTNNSGTPTTSVDIDADNAILVSTAGDGIRTGAVNLTVACAGTGANGLDTGSLANNTWYYLYIISNGTTTAGLASTSATSPTMPSGYTYKYRVGAIRTGGSATFIRLRQVGNRAQYVVVSGSVTPTYPRMANGTATQWTAIDVGSYVPTTARVIYLIAHVQDLDVLGVSANNQTDTAFDAAVNPPIFHARSAASNIRNSIPVSMVLESTNIYWESDGTGSEIFCYGWVDAVNAN